MQGDTNEVKTSWWHLDEDLLYAFNSKSSAVAQQSLSAMLLAAASALLVLS